MDGDRGRAVSCNSDGSRLEMILELNRKTTFDTIDYSRAISAETKKELAMVCSYVSRVIRRRVCWVNSLMAP
jgi:hypothetical protein